MKELKNVPGLKPEDVVKIKKFTYGDNARISGKCAKIDQKTMKPDIDFGNYKIYTLVYGIIDAPFLENKSDKAMVIMNLPKETGEFIFKEIAEYNEMGNLIDTKKKSDGS